MKKRKKTITLPDGSTYVGDFIEDETLPNEDEFTIFCGETDETKNFHGFGIYTFLSGEKYKGEFKDGEFHGQGTLTFSNGEKYIGEFKNSKFHGQGTKTFSDGSKKQGKWENGKFIG